MLPQLLLLLLLPCLLLYGYPPLLFSHAPLVPARELWAAVHQGLHQHRRVRGDAPLIEELARQSAQIDLNRLSRCNFSFRRRSTRWQDATLRHDVRGIRMRVCELFPHTHTHTYRQRPETASLVGRTRRLTSCAAIGMGAPLSQPRARGGRRRVQGERRRLQGERRSIANRSEAAHKAAGGIRQGHATCRRQKNHKISLFGDDVLRVSTLLEFPSAFAGCDCCTHCLCETAMAFLEFLGHGQAEGQPLASFFR